MDMLAITNLQKRFGYKSVLKGLDLSVPEHSVFGFIGKAPLLQMGGNCSLIYSV